MCLIVEMGVSGYYTPVDVFWVSTRIGIVLVYCALVIADNVKTIQWLPLVLIALSLMSVRDKWQAIEKEKITGIKTDAKTSVKEPKEPKLPDCEGLVKWRKDECDSKIEKLQLAYNKSLKEYNSWIRQSETKIQNATVELSWYDQQPVWIYICLVMAMSWLTLVSTPEETEAPQKDERDIRARVIARIEGGMSNLQISSDLGIDRRKVAQIKREIEQKRTINVQPMSNVVKFEGKKRA